MESFPRRLGIATAAFAASLAPGLFAQESLRNSLEFGEINAQRQKNFLNQHYNLKLGPVLFNSRAGMSISYNDNINLSGTAAKEDIILHPSVGLGVIWQMTQYNRLALDTSFGYTKYINHPENDRPTISPGTTSDISYDFSIGAFQFNAHDRFSYHQDPLAYGSGSVSGTTDLARFRNAIGLNGSWRMRDAILSAGYDHANTIMFNPRFENSNSSSELVFARATYLWNPTVQFGGEATGGMTDYELPIRPDNRNYTIGPFVSWRLTSALNLTARAGLSGYTLTSPGALGDLAAPLSFYGSVDVDHRVNEWMTQNLSVNRSTGQGIGLSANFIQTTAVNYGARFEIIRDVGLSARLFYEKSDDNSSAASASALYLAESYTRYGGGLSLHYQLMEKLSASLNYLRTEKSSSVSLFGYAQNSVTIGMNYHF